jgi:hypothetical protein
MNLPFFLSMARVPHGPENLGDCRLWSGERRVKDKRFVTCGIPEFRAIRRLLAKIRPSSATSGKSDAPGPHSDAERYVPPHAR